MGTETTADEVFQLLSDEIRLDVLRTVAVAQHENSQTGVAELSFSEIYDRVDSTTPPSYRTIRVQQSGQNGRRPK